jgi:hypothetical protein
MNNQGVFDNIKESFCSLWTFKERGSTLEIITPYSTTTSKFISVFITEQANKFVVTDGSWLTIGEYETTPDFDDEMFLKIFHHYETFYEVSKLDTPAGIYYFKSTENEALIPNLVYDLTNFLCTIISASQIQFVDPKEKEEKETFRKVADSYISGFVNKEIIKFNNQLGDDYKTVRFNAIVSRGPKMNLVKYITGSTPSYFLSSLTKATVDFEIANNSPFNDYIDKRVALINDTADGFVAGRLYRHLETLEEHTHIPTVKWTSKEQLVNLL